MDLLFEKMVRQILSEGSDNSATQEAILANIIKHYKAEPTFAENRLPFGLQLTRIILNIGNEFKLTAFFNSCMFYEAHSNEINTAGVIPWITSRGVKTIFIYNRKFMNSLCHYFISGNEVGEKEWSAAYAKNPDNPALTYDIGKMLFLFAHESMHIFRNHSDRRQKQNKDHYKYNIASDAVINYTLAHKIKRVAGHDMKFIDGGVMLDRPKYLQWLKDKKHHKGGEDEDEFNRHLNADKTYDFYDETNPLPPPQKPKPVNVGDIRRINEGPNKGDHVRVTSVNKDGTCECEVVDIKEIIKDARREYKAKKAGNFIKTNSKVSNFSRPREDRRFEVPQIGGKFDIDGLDN